MDKIIIKLTESEVVYLNQGLVIAMKTLDKHANGSDKILADRLETILNKINSPTK